MYLKGWEGLKCIAYDFKIVYILKHIRFCYHLILKWLYFDAHFNGDQERVVKDGEGPHVQARG